MTPMIERERWCFDQLEARELTVAELHDLSPVRVCPGWEAYDDMGVLDPVTGGRGTRETSRQTIYTALERLRLRGKVDRRFERGRDGSQRRQSVYFRMGVPLADDIAALESNW